MISLIPFALAFLVMVLAASVQGAVGFGANLLAAPLLVLIDPALVPVPIIVSATAMNVLVLRRDRLEGAWRSLRVPIVAQAGGAALAAGLVASVSGAGLDVVMASIILLAVGLSASGLQPPATQLSLAIGGASSGFMGTASGIGGPPMALVLQHLQGVALRATLARFFIAGALVSLCALALVGQVTAASVIAGLGLVPGILVGFVLSRFLARRVDRGNVRRAVLVLSGTSALLVLVRALLS